MKRLLYLLLLIAPFALLSIPSFGQCDINTGCGGTPILSIDPPTFDAATSTISFNNITFGEFECTATEYQSGVVIYIYQLLPDGSRMESCGVLNDAPYNVVGSISLGFGQSSFCSGSTSNVGTLLLGPDEGFESCDGAFLEIEAVLFVTNDLVFDPSEASVYSELSSNEFISVDLGTLSINLNNEFPANGQPLTSALINEMDTGADGPLTVNCGEDVFLYVEALSRLANCLEYDDISTGIASELSNELYYTINGGAPVFLANAATGAAGGVLTGPDPALADACYAGILGPLPFLWEDLPDDLCDGSTVVVTVTTTDVFTGLTVSDDITLNYTGAVCNNCAIPGCMDMTACNYDPGATEDDGSCMPTPTCNTDPCAGDLEVIDPNDACVCIVDQVQVNGCTDATACNYDANANCNDGSCDFGNPACADPCILTFGCIDDTACNFDPNACADDGSCTFAPCNPGCTDPCADNYDATADEDDGTCIPYDDTCNVDCTIGPFGGTWDAATCACINETTPVTGCTDATACNYDAAANCDHNSCDFGVTACTDPCNPVMGCTDATACNYDAAACVDDGSCFAPPCVPGCTDPCADNYDANADEDDGSCSPYDNTCNTDCTLGPFGGTWDATTCACINETTPIPGCTDNTANNYDPAANCDDGNCGFDPVCSVEAASISGGPFQFCVSDGISDFVSGISVSGGVGVNSAWVITDDQLNILGLPGMPGEVDFDGAGGGSCLIWYVTFDDIVGAEVGSNAADLTGCFALSNSIEVVRQDCSPCEEEITGAIIVPDAGCDVGGITISIIAPDGTMINVVTEADGTFTVPGSPFPCGSYTAAFFDPSEIPACYAETGSTEPINFDLDGSQGGDDDFQFIANPSIPTLSQWGLIILALLLMSFGAIQLYISTNRYLFRNL